jgi:hypothetical protein
MSDKKCEGIKFAELSNAKNMDASTKHIDATDAAAYNNTQLLRKKESKRDNDL